MANKKTLQEQADGIVISYSYGKDSTAMIFAALELGYKVDEIVTCDIMFDEKTSCELPETVKWKEYADSRIEELTGISVTHIRSPHTFKDLFYMGFTKQPELIQGFPICTHGYTWCSIELKKKIIDKYCQGKKIAIGYAREEFERRGKSYAKRKAYCFPLVEAEWTEAKCRAVAEGKGLLMPDYETQTRGGCWFCPKQNYDKLRHLYHDNPDLFEKLLKLDEDAITAGTLKFNARADVAQFAKRFELEDAGLVPADARFRWKMLDHFQFEGFCFNGDEVTMT